MRDKRDSKARAPAVKNMALDFDNTLTMLENVCYACEHKVKWPDLAARREINEQLKRALAYCKSMQQRYPRTKAMFR